MATTAAAPGSEPPITPLPPDYTPESGGQLPPPPPYSVAAAPTLPRRPFPRSNSGGATDDGPAHPPIPRPPRRGYSEDSTGSGPSSWRKFTNSISRAGRGSSDVGSGGSASKDKPLPAVPGESRSSRRSSVPLFVPQLAQGSGWGTSFQRSAPPAAARQGQPSGAPVTPPRHQVLNAQPTSSPSLNVSNRNAAPPVPPRPTGPPSYPPVSAYQARSLMAPRPSLHPNNPPTAQVERTPPRPAPAPVPNTSTSFRPSSLYAPNPQLTTHAPALRPAPIPAHIRVPAPAPQPQPVRTASGPIPSQSQSRPSRPARPISAQATSSTTSSTRRGSAPGSTTAKTTPPKGSTTKPKKLTKYVPKAPSGVSFMSPLYAAASPKKQTSSATTSKNSSPTRFVTTPPRRGLSRDFIDLTLESDDETPESSEEDVGVRTRGAARAANAANASPAASRAGKGKPSPKGKHAWTPPTKRAPPKPASASGSGSSTPAIGPGAGTPVRCAGYTRSGQPCKRMVRARAPFLAAQSQGPAGLDDDEDRPRAGAVGRYCRDHAGLVCAADGFYWRDARGKAGVWIDFKDYIPSDLGQQTQTLLRVTMESPLTTKDTPGFLYAYEIRSLSTPSTSYFKVGRSDNVPRRMGQWTKQCGHIPTLRDVFPLRAPSARLAHAQGGGAGLGRAPSILGSLLPGATKAGTDAARMVPAVKRWERLVHLELADRAATAKPKEYDALCVPCADCGAVHREIFPLDGGSRVYEQVVVDAVERWERFVRAIAQ